MPLFATVSELQGHLKSTIAMSQIDKVVKKVMREYIDANVYQRYTPSGHMAYDRTMELLGAVDIKERRISNTKFTFEVYINTDMLTSNGSLSDDGRWNQHASMPQGGASNIYDTREFIPLWLEEGTSGSLWDRDGAHFASDAHDKLSHGGVLVSKLALELRRAGYNVTFSG